MHPLIRAPKPPPLPDPKFPKEPGEKILPPPSSLPEPRTFSKTITVLGTDKLRIPIIYGKVRTGAVIVWEKPLSNGSWLSCYIIGWGPINSISNLKINNESLSLFNVSTSIYLGNTTTNAAVNSSLAANDSSWTSRLPGLAYIVCTFPNPLTYTDGKEPDPHSLMCDVEGLLTPDHRLDSSLTTLYYTENVAVCRADFWTNIRYGGKRPINTIDWNTVDAAANECDHNIGGGKKRFKIGLKLGPDKADWSENDRLMRIHAQMWDANSNGLWQMFVDVDQTVSSIVLTDVGTSSNIIDAYMRDKEPEEVPNHFEFTYTDQANEFKPGNAITEDPGIGLRTIAQTISANYDTHGSPDYDQSKRLSIWAFNRSRLDKEYIIDTLYDGGVKCVPGLVITVTDTDIDVSNQLMIVKSTEDIDELSFRISCELFSHTTYLDTQQTTFASAPPSGTSPYGPLPAPTGFSVTPQDEETQVGIFLPQALITFTPYSGVSAGGTLLTMKVGSGPVVSYGPYLSSPARIPIPQGYGQSVVIKGYSVDRNTGQPGTAFASSSFTTYDPTTPEAISTIIIDGDNAYWDKPPIRSFLSSNSWVAQGYTTFDATKMNNGNFGDNALEFPATTIGFDPISHPAGAYVYFDTGGISVKELHITWLDSLDINNEIFFKPFYYNGTSWLEPLHWKQYKVSDTKSIVYLGDTPGSATPIMLAPFTSTPNAPVARIAEIQPVHYTGATYQYIKGYRLTGNDVNGNLWQKDILYTPDSVNGVKLEEWRKTEYKYFTEYDASLLVRNETFLQVQTISISNNVTSIAVPYISIGIFSPSGSPTSLDVTGLTIGFGDNISKYMSKTDIWGIGTIAAGSIGQHTITVMGTAFGDTCVASCSDNLATYGVFMIAEAKINSVQVTIFNFNSFSVTIPTSTIRVDVWQH